MHWSAVFKILAFEMRKQTAFLFKPAPELSGHVPHKGHWLSGQTSGFPPRRSRLYLMIDQSIRDGGQHYINCTNAGFWYISGKQRHVPHKGHWLSGQLVRQRRDLTDSVGEFVRGRSNDPPAPIFDGRRAFVQSGAAANTLGRGTACAPHRSAWLTISIANSAIMRTRIAIELTPSCI